MTFAPTTSSETVGKTLRVERRAFPAPPAMAGNAAGSTEAKVAQAMSQVAPVLSSAAKGADLDEERLIQMITEQVIKQLS